MLLGGLLLVNPGAGAIGITWAIGWVVLLFGIDELWLASEVRREAHGLTRLERPVSHTHVTA